MSKNLDICPIDKIRFFIQFFTGVIGIGAPVELSETTGALHAFNIPLIAVGHKYHGKKYDNILSTSPDVQGQAKVSFIKNCYDRFLIGFCIVLNMSSNHFFSLQLELNDFHFLELTRFFLIFQKKIVLDYWFHKFHFSF